MNYDRTYKQRLLLYLLLAWEPSAAQVTHSYSRRLPALIRSLPGNKLFAIKVDPLKFESQNQAKNIPVGLPRPPFKLGKIGPGVSEL